MTLSRFLKDYVYIPLGGNRKGEVRTYTNLFLTFLLGGIWHGAGWTFVLWGALHGIALIIHRAWNQLGFKMNTLLAWFITFNFVNIGWVFFRATTFDDAIKVLKGMFGMDAIVLPNALASKLAFLKHYGIEFGSFVNAINGDLYTLIWVMAGFVMILLFKNSIELSRGFTVNRKYFLFTVCLFFGTVAYIGKVSEFLYFNF
jgi:hypothetical protein